MKNTIINKVLVLSFVMALVGCSEEDLSLESPNDPLQGEITSYEEAAFGMYDAYQKVPANEYLVTELRSDNMVSESGDGDLGFLGSYRISADVGDGASYWTNNYSVILNANIVLANRELISEDDDLRAQLVGEAYFMRALSHFNLVRAFRRVPFMNRPLLNKKDVLNFPQLAPDAMYANIIADFLSAIENLEDAGSVFARNKANVPAAMGLLAKAYMSQDVPDYGAALPLLEALVALDGSILGLEANFSELFDSGNELNSEILFAVSYGGGTAVSADTDFDSQVEGDSQEISFAMGPQGRAGGMVFEQDFMDAILPFEWEDNVGGDARTVRWRENGEAFGVDDDDDDYHRLYQFDANEERYFNAKFDDGTDDTSAIDWIVLRFADILLLHAEAVIGNGRSTTDAFVLE